MVKSPAYIIYNGIVSRRRKIIKCDRKKTFIIGTILLFHTLYIITASRFFWFDFFFLGDGILYNWQILIIILRWFFLEAVCDLSIVSDFERLVKGIFFVWFFGCFDDFLAVFDHHLLGVVVVEITLEDLDFAHPRPTKIRLFGAAPDDFGVSEADVPEKWEKNVIKNRIS